MSKEPIDLQAKRNEIPRHEMPMSGQELESVIEVLELQAEDCLEDGRLDDALYWQTLAVKFRTARRSMPA